MGKKHRSKQEIYEQDQKARQQGASKKNFTLHDLKTIYPKNETQRIAVESYFSGTNLALIGSAGTGKTLLGMYLGLSDVLSDDMRYKKIVIVRSAVPTRDQGFLAGDLTEKELVYQQPYIQICDSLFDYSKSYENLVKSKYIEFITTSYIRGTTFDDSIILFDEAQSANLHEISTVITRMGKNSKLIICGDHVQSDLIKSKYDVSGLFEFVRIAQNMEEVDIVKFSPNDIVRSGIVRSYLIEKEKLGIC